MRLLIVPPTLSITSIAHLPFSKTIHLRLFMTLRKLDPLTTDFECSQEHDDASPSSEWLKRDDTTEQLASTSGTRSTNTLSVAQRERKRANDRNAQHAFRQNIKARIQSLETTTSEIRRSWQAIEQDISATQQRNRDLEEENAYLQEKIRRAGLLTKLPSQCRAMTAEHAPPKQS